MYGSSLARARSGTARIVIVVRRPFSTRFVRARGRNKISSYRRRCRARNSTRDARRTEPRRGRRLRTGFRYR